jgi:uncharacterized repeat protein (TIGR04052 family)
MTNSTRPFILAMVALAASSEHVRAQAAGVTSPSRTERSVTLHFEATVGDESFACGNRYEGIGVTHSAITVGDLRLYVSAVRLIRDDGVDVPLSLTPDGLWQQNDVALLDFEDGTKSCANGTPELRSVVEGLVPSAQYVGVRFVVGVPFEKNHREPTLQPSPLNLTRMFWNWNGGYKFLRIDLKTTGQPQGWSIHLGSTGCTPHDGPTTVPIACTSINEVTVNFPAFDVDHDVVRFDLRSLLADSNVDVNQEDTAVGCMSGPDDEDCAPLFHQLGLPFNKAPSGMQRVFAVRRGAVISVAGERP